MLSWFRQNWPWTLFLGLLATYGFRLLGDTDAYTRVMDPGRYWEQKVSKYERGIDYRRRSIKDSMLHIEMLEAIRPIAVERERVWDGSPELEADEIHQQILSERDSIHRYQSEIAEYEQRLIQAIDELNRY